MKQQNRNERHHQHRLKWRTRDIVDVKGSAQKNKEKENSVFSVVLFLICRYRQRQTCFSRCTPRCKPNTYTDKNLYCQEVKGTDRKQSCFSICLVDFCPWGDRSHSDVSLSHAVAGAKRFYPLLPSSRFFPAKTHWNHQGIKMFFKDLMGHMTEIWVITLREKKFNITVLVQVSVFCNLKIFKLNACQRVAIHCNISEYGWIKTDEHIDE